MTFTETIKKMSSKSAHAYFEQKLKYEIDPVGMKRKMERGDTNYQLIDVRSPEAYKEGHIRGAKSVPFEEFDSRTWEFSEGKDNIVYCYSLTCQLADRAAFWLAEHGYPVKMLIGGFDVWQEMGHSVEK